MTTSFNGSTIRSNFRPGYSLVPQDLNVSGPPFFPHYATLCIFFLFRYYEIRFLSTLLQMCLTELIGALSPTLPAYLYLPRSIHSTAPPPSASPAHAFQANMVACKGPPQAYSVQRLSHLPPQIWARYFFSVLVLVASGLSFWISKRRRFSFSSMTPSC